MGAYEIGRALDDFVIKQVSHSSTEKYDSDFGIFNIKGIKIEVMGDLRVFRNGKWCSIQNPNNVKITGVSIEKWVIPVVSLDTQRSSGYFEERIRRTR